MDHLPLLPETVQRCGGVVALPGASNSLDMNLMKVKEANRTLSYFISALRERKHRIAGGELPLPYPTLSPSPNPTSFSCEAALKTDDSLDLPAFSLAPLNPLSNGSQMF